MDIDARPPIRDGQQRPYALRLDSKGTVRCHPCGGTRWIEVFDQRSTPNSFTPTVRPCECHAGYERWAQGWPRVEGAKHSQPEFVPKRGHVRESAMQGQF